MEEKEFKKLLGLKIKNQRSKLNLTQEQFSELIGLSQRQVSLIELGKSFPKPVTILKISKVFNFNLSDLFDLEPDLSETELKKELIKLVNSLSVDKLQTLYTISKNI